MLKNTLYVLNKENLNSKLSVPHGIFPPETRWLKVSMAKGCIIIQPCGQLYANARLQEHWRPNRDVVHVSAVNGHNSILPLGTHGHDYTIYRYGKTGIAFRYA